MVDASLVDRFNTTKRLALAINNAGYADAAIVDYGWFMKTLPFYGEGSMWPITRVNWR